MMIALDTGCKKDNKIKITMMLQDNPPGIISRVRFKNSALFTRILLWRWHYLPKRLANQPF